MKTTMITTIKEECAMIPVITVCDKQGRSSTDLLSLDFFENRKIHLTGEINDNLADEIIVQIEHLAAKSREDITIVINSPGGSVSAGLAIYDAMNRCGCDVRTVCTGIAASMGAFLLSSGTRGKRFCTPMSEVMIHQPLGGVQGQASDIQRAAEHIVVIKEKLNRILARNTGKSVDTVAKDTDRDTYLSAEEALEYGLVDSLLK